MNPGRIGAFLALQRSTVGLLFMAVLVGMAALGGAFLWMISPQVNLWTAFGFGAVGTVYFGVFGKDVQHSKA